jgi:hypothetical protein
MASEKHSATHRVGGPGASHENRKHPEKSKPHADISREDVQSGNAQQREQNKRMDQANVDQQGDRANVRQNTTHQGNRRSS